MSAAIHSWTSSYWFVGLLAVMIGVLVVSASLALDWTLHGEIRKVYASDILEGSIAAILSGAALLRLQVRRRELLVRMQTVEDVNHHVRNALASIVLTASLRSDEDLNALLKDACDRIDWVLNDVLPQSIQGADLKSESAPWKSGRQLKPVDLHSRSHSKHRTEPNPPRD